jgi:hypothetical protein
MYGRVLKRGLQVAQLALAAARLAAASQGVPLPGALGRVFGQAEAEAVTQLEALLGEECLQLGEELAAAARDRTTEAVSDVASSSSDSLDAALELNKDEPTAELISERVTVATGASYRALRALVLEQDPHLFRTGLDRVQANDRSVEWVSERGAAAFREQGRRALLATVQVDAERP